MTELVKVTMSKIYEIQKVKKNFTKTLYLIILLSPINPRSDGQFLCVFCL